jgi:hypothetical protein
MKDPQSCPNYQGLEAVRRHPECGIIRREIYGRLRIPASGFFPAGGESNPVTNYWRELILKNSLKKTCETVNNN